MPRQLRDIAAAMMLMAGPIPAQSNPGSCTLFGPIFGVDPLGGTLLIKDAGGYLKNVRLPSGRNISKLPVTDGGQITKISPSDLNSGDLVCVHGGDATSPQLSVVTRADVHRAQSDFLVKWQRNSLFGKLTAVDAPSRTIMVVPSTGDTPVRVSLPLSVKLRTAPPGARRITESTSFELSDLQVGESVYVRGSRSADAPQIVASLVLKDGFRGILGTLIEVHVFSTTLRIREFGTDETLSLKMTGSEAYRTTENLTHPMRVETASGVVLAPVGLADLQPGDAILVIGRTTGATEGEGIVAVTKFGTFGVAPQDAQGHISWLLSK